MPEINTQPHTAVSEAQAVTRLPGKPKAKLFVLALAVLVVLALAYYFFLYRQPYQFRSYQDSRGNSFSTEVPAKFAPELVPQGALSPQYWENTQTTGAIFAVNKPLGQVFEDYQSQLLALGWEIKSKDSSEASAVIAAFNKQTGKAIQAQLDTLPNKSTSVRVSLPK